MAGTWPLILLPWPGPESMWTWPPSASIRSAMPRRPVPCCMVLGSKPWPLSATSNRSSALLSDRRTLAREASACFAVLLCLQGAEVHGGLGFLRVAPDGSREASAASGSVASHPASPDAQAGLVLQRHFVILRHAAQ